MLWITLYIVDHILLYCEYTSYVVCTFDIKWVTLYSVGDIYLVGTHNMLWVHILWGTYVVDNTVYIVDYILLYCGYICYVVCTSNIMWVALYAVGNLYIVGAHFMLWVHVFW